jgi:hypothetical protein
MFVYQRYVFELLDVVWVRRVQLVRREELVYVNISPYRKAECMLGQWMDITTMRGADPLWPESLISSLYDDHGHGMTVAAPEPTRVLRLEFRPRNGEERTSTSIPEHLLGF